MDERAQLVISELKLLCSMYSQKELQFTDLNFYELILHGDDCCLKPFFNNSAIEFTLTELQSFMELNFNLSSTYPNTPPAVYARKSGFSKIDALNSKLREHIATLKLGLPMIIDILQWTVANFPANDTFDEAGDTTELLFSKGQKFTRLWIHSHHIYSKFKRKSLISLANDLKLNGFSLPGKPGVVCAEGPTEVCNRFLTEIRVWSWQKLTLRHREDWDANNNVQNSASSNWLKFKPFEEICFSDRMRDLQRFLLEHHCMDAFHWLFGLGGQSAAN